MTTTRDRKDVVKILDMQASRANQTGRGATSKQTWFLAGLLIEKLDEQQLENELTSIMQSPLTSKEASDYIDHLLKL
jgi:hypothetical protein